MLSKSQLTQKLQLIMGMSWKLPKTILLELKCQKRDDMIQKGWAINEDGIVKIALASIKLPTDNLPLSHETNATLKKIDIR
ncbi:hypothetical protein OL548_34250 (plasmid) [Lysinibacillus sp. MHQ-1]|nr:hypothetical protein OL548_34250 [Lysinibacillus sp. MHQ-1]